VQGLDLLRGFAVGLVILRHAAPHVFAGAGVVGVVMFFAISGYLITGVLVGDLEQTGRIDRRGFYLRRAARLVPALVLLVAGVVVVTVLLDPLADRDELAKTVLVAMTWTANLPFAHASEATFHLWTLATEEQFYLLWPAVLGLGFARRRVGLALLATGLACAVATVATVVWLSEDPDLAYALPTSWAGCFVVGAAVRLYGDRVPKPNGLAVGAGLTCLAVLSVVPLRGHALTYLAGGPAIAALTGLLLLAWREWQTVRPPALRLLVWLGTVSYAAYLWNYPLALWLEPTVPQARLVAVPLTLVVAWLSTAYVEEPALRRARGRTRVPVAA
jgi:peptidoglycan/LPS O-acetylase OafA/YrhL